MTSLNDDAPDPVASEPADDDPVAAMMPAIQAYAVLLAGQTAGQAAYEAATIEVSSAMLYEKEPTLGDFRRAMLEAIEQAISPDQQPPPSGAPEADRLAALPFADRRLYLMARLMDLPPEEIARATGHELAALPGLLRRIEQTLSMAASA